MRVSDWIKNLTEIKNKLQLSVKASKIGFWEWELNTNKVYFSKEWKRQIGFKDKEVPNTYREWEKRVHPDDIDELNKNINQYFNNNVLPKYKIFDKTVEKDEF